MNKNYSTIRYHIYRELHKYQVEQERRKKSLFNEFSIPVFSGLISAIIASEITQNSSISATWTIVCIIGTYWLIMIVSLLFISIYKYFKRYFHPNKTSYLSGIIEEISAAKFNYEVSYLVETSYSQMLSLSAEPQLRKLQMIDVCFNLKNALRKISESILAYTKNKGDKGKIRPDFLMPEKLEAIMNIIYYTLAKLELEKCKCDEITSLIETYNIYQKYISDLYGLKFNEYVSITH